jgi:peptide deformylase
VLKRYRRVTGVGRGLAAPQIGISRRVFVTYVGDTFRTFINPRITNSFDAKNRYRELCMSAEGVWGDIERPAVVELAWVDEYGASHTELFETFMARLVQHEYDHLEGIVCIDRAISGTVGPVSSNPLEEQLRSS